ncbi:uncharacterized protein LOC127246405 isoform X2 [Andrographis paniculata]|uniref:uncharacterized protein LOC127246405 isoform X2 n=1 Tax=Andrographis paniculata TaxID=175694 RepID=UPI0021E745F9|nr:uncharacterized protein LOC127246405 isoform X2 [Andrographis paniculata]
MEKQGSSSRELQCVGRLEISKPKPVGFLCGSIPVTADEAFKDFSSAAMVPSPHTAPRYQMIPNQTDLNALPLLSSIPEKVLPLAAAQSGTSEDLQWQDGPVSANLARKGEALAVSGIANYGDELDVIAPADILKQIFKIPYSKARVSVAVHRVGQTLILNSGPDIEEGENLIRRQKRQPKCVDQSLFLNFAMHSVRMEACDCPPSHNTSSNGQFESSIYRNECMPNEGPFETSDQATKGNACYRNHEGIAQGKEYIHQQEFPQSVNENLFWGKKKNKRHKSHGTIEKVSNVKEKPECPVQESEKRRNTGDDGFLRVLFWQFHNFRMLLGSDLLIFSNEKYVAVSLHLWDVSRKVTPLTWLEAWLDNFMASVPELAICYHQDGVVQGYELLKTDDIFLLKGVSDDGTPAFHPHIVQQNGLSVLRFLQDNCKQDPGAYWLYKSAGEDVIQLFDLSVIPKGHTADSYHDSSSSLPSLIYRGRNDSILSLGTLLYRVAHRLSLAMSPDKRVKCTGFFQKCLGLLDEPDHLVVRALAHEQFARLLLTYDEEMELASAVIPVESEVTISNAEEEYLEFVGGLSASYTQDIGHAPIIAQQQLEEAEHGKDFEEESAEILTCQKISSPTIRGGSLVANENLFIVGDKNTSVSNSPVNSDDVVQNAAGIVSSKLAAIQHVSQAIKSLRWTRKLRISRPELNLESENVDDLHSSVDYSLCACGDPDCIEVCDIREWLPTSKIDDRLWKLVLLLGEAYLALGQAYKNDGQLYQALKVVELSCLVYGSMPQDMRFISSMVSSALSKPESDGRGQSAPANSGDSFTTDGLSSNYLFWARAWTLVGDVFVEFYLMKGQEVSMKQEKQQHAKDLKMSSEVLKEVERLKKKMERFNQNCSSCSLINCSCRSDRASSGNSASSSARDSSMSSYTRKQNRKSSGKNNLYARPGVHEDDVSQKSDLRNLSGAEYTKHFRSDLGNETYISDAMQDIDLTGGSLGKADDHNETDDSGPGENAPSESTSKGTTAGKIGGIFRYLRSTVSGDADYTLSTSLSCYEEARKAIAGLPASAEEPQAILKKKGWVCNELGRYRLEMKDLAKAETAFAEAIDAFRQVEDHTNVILINCNLGHGRRALAEEMVSKIASLKRHSLFQNAYLQALEMAKLQYREALRFYGAAKTELITLSEKAVSVSCSLKNEVNTQFAHTYLKLGMLLARENTVAEVYENGFLVDHPISMPNQMRVESRKHEISANDAIREALAVYESLGESRKQEAAYAHFQLACYQRECCLRFLESDKENNKLGKGESSLGQKIKQYTALAERNWQKSIDFYGPKTHPVMYLTILIDRSALLLTLSSYLHSYTLLESALTQLLEGRHVSENCSLSEENPELCAKFWSQLQMLLKNMLAMTRSTKANKHPLNPHPSPMSKYADAKKLAELYKISLKLADFKELQRMHSLWTE